METNWSNGEQCKKVAATSRRFQCHDIGSTNTEVNNLKRRDALTSRHLNVATLQRHDVSLRSAPHHLKYEWLRNRGGSGGVRTRARNSRAE